MREIGGEGIRTSGVDATARFVGAAPLQLKHRSVASTPRSARDAASRVLRRDTVQPVESSLSKKSCRHELFRALRRPANMRTSTFTSAPAGCKAAVGQPAGSHCCVPIKLSQFANCMSRTQFAN